MNVSFAVKNIEMIKTYPLFERFIPAEDEREFIVLFTKEAEGIVVASNNPNCPIGHTANTWNMDCFEPFYGTITIS